MLIKLSNDTWVNSEKITYIEKQIGGNPYNYIVRFEGKDTLTLNKAHFDELMIAITNRERMAHDYT